MNERGSAVLKVFCGLKWGLMLSPGPPIVRQISRKSIPHNRDTAMKVSLNEEDQAKKDVV